MLETFTKLGIVATAVIALLPIYAVRQRMHQATESADASTSEACSVVLFRLFLAVGFGITLPSTGVLVIPQLPAGIDPNVVWILLGAVAWLQAAAFLILGALIVLYGTDVIIIAAAIRLPSDRQRWTLAKHRRVAVLALVAVVAPWVPFMLGTWTMTSAELWANAHPTAHIVLSGLYAAPLMYLVVVILKHIELLDPTSATAQFERTNHHA